MSRKPRKPVPQRANPVVASPQDPAPASNDLKVLLLGALLIFGATLISYWPALGAGFVWDDEQHFGASRITPTLDGLLYLWKGHRFYYPLTSTTFWALRCIWDQNPLPFHLLTILLHVANSILLWRIAKRLKFAWPFACGLVFALHPVHVQSVAWATELKNTQSGLFYLLALFAFIRFGDGKSERSYIASLLFFLLALLSKTSTVTFPFIALFVHFWRGGGWSKSSIFRLAPYFALSALMGGLTVLFHEGQVSTLNDWDESLAQRIFLAARGIWHYILKLFWPFPLTFVYPRWNLQGSLAIWLLPCFALIAASVALGLLARRSKSARILLIGFAAFVASLLPVLNFLKMFYTRYAYVADHWQYLADMVSVPLLVSLFVAVLERSPRFWIKRAWALGFLACALGAATFAQSGDYLDLETLWRQILRKNPDAWIARVNLGILLAQKGQSEAAWKQYELALEERNDIAEAYIAMGTIRFGEKNYKGAEEILRRGLEETPNDIHLLNNLAACLAWMERYGESKEVVEQAIALDPKDAESRVNLARVYDAIGRFEEAVDACRIAIDLDPFSAKARRQIADSLKKLGRLEEAVTQYGYALGLDPTDADSATSASALLGSMGRLQDAIVLLEAAKNHNPENAGILFNLGVTLKKLGREADSKAYFEQAARLDPQFAR